MILTVSKTFQFHAAHKIPHHLGHCRNLHGHTYTVTIHATGPIIESGSSEGMVMDFGDIKALYNEVIHRRCDHRFLNDQFDFPTTAENLATIFLLELHAEDARISRVDVSEGPGNIATAQVS